MATRKFWGWGVVEDDLTPAEVQAHGKRMAERYGVPLTYTPPPRIEEVTLRPPRVPPPATLAHLCTDAPLERAGHTYGKAFKLTPYGRTRALARCTPWSRRCIPDTPA
jgi:alkyldihydroxyacetonephosphate synthase